MEEESMALLTGGYAVIHSTLFLVDWNFDR
jgi:hypothetical protein